MGLRLKASDLDFKVCDLDGLGFGGMWFGCGLGFGAQGFNTPNSARSELCNLKQIIRVVKDSLPPRLQTKSFLMLPSAVTLNPNCLNSRT